jgi:hypothetical protein
VQLPERPAVEVHVPNLQGGGLLRAQPRVIQGAEQRIISRGRRPRPRRLQPVAEKSKNASTRSTVGGGTSPGVSEDHMSRAVEPIQRITQQAAEQRLDLDRHARF